MEQPLVDLYNCVEHKTYPGNNPLEFNLYKLASLPDLLQGIVYIFPLFYQGKLCVRHLVTGTLSGILPQILDMLKHQFRVTDVNVLPWEFYTKKDLSLMSSKIGPTPQPATTFRRKFGSTDIKKCNKKQHFNTSEQQQAKAGGNLLHSICAQSKGRSKQPSTQVCFKQLFSQPSSWGSTSPRLIPPIFFVPKINLYNSRHDSYHDSTHESTQK